MRAALLEALIKVTIAHYQAMPQPPRQLAMGEQVQAAGVLQLMALALAHRVADGRRVRRRGCAHGGGHH